MTDNDKFVSTDDIIVFIYFCVGIHTAFKMNENGDFKFCFMVIVDSENDAS